MMAKWHRVSAANINEQHMSYSGCMCADFKDFYKFGEVPEMKANEEVGSWDLSCWIQLKMLDFQKNGYWVFL